MMLWTLIRKEIVLHILSLRFGITFILFILLVFASFYVTTNVYQRDKASYAVGERRSMDYLNDILKEEDGRKRWEQLTNWDGRLDPVPVAELSVIAQGVQPFLPMSLVTTSGSSRDVGDTFGRNPFASLLRVPDMVYIVSVVVSLLAILFAFDAIAGEKESGTLRFMLSNAVPRDRILLAKWLGGYVVLIIPFLMAVFGGLGYVWWRGALALTSENVQRLGILVVAACLYISVFFTLSLFVSTLTHRATTALFACLFVWVLWILVLPNLAPVVAKIVSPTPSVEKINAEKAAVDRETYLLMQRITQTSPAVKYGQAIERKKDKLEEECQRRKRQWDRFLSEANRRQTNLAQTLGRLSPSVCWTYAAVALMNTGPGSHRQFRMAQDRLVREMSDFRSQISQEQRNSGSGEWREINSIEVPRLRISAIALNTATRNALNDILILTVLNVAFFMMAFVFFLRYDVR